MCLAVILIPELAPASDAKPFWVRNGAMIGSVAEHRAMLGATATRTNGVPILAH